MKTLDKCVKHSPLSHGGHIVPGDQKSFFFSMLSVAMETMGDEA